MSKKISEEHLPLKCFRLTWIKTLLPIDFCKIVCTKLQSSSICPVSFIQKNGISIWLKFGCSTRKQYLWWFIWLFYTAWRVSVFKVILVGIVPHSDWTWRGTEYLSVFNPNAGKWRPESLRIRALSMQCYL